MQIPLHYEFFRGQTLQIVQVKSGAMISSSPLNVILNITSSIITKFPNDVRAHVDQAQRFSAVMTRMAVPNYIFAIDVPNPPFKA